MPHYFKIPFHALILAAFLALLETGRLSIPAIVAFLGAFAVVVYRTYRAAPRTLSSRASSLLSAAYIVFFPLDVLILSRSFIVALIHLVLFLEIVKLAQAKRDRDYLSLMFLAFLQVLAASSLTIDTSFAVTFLLFLVALVSTLMSFEIYRETRETEATSQSGVGLPVGGMSLWITSWIVVLGFGLFFVIPRAGTGYFTRAATEALLLSGFNESVELGEIGQVKLSSRLVMRTRRLEGSLLASPKWRGVTLDTFDGHSWYRSDPERRAVFRSGENEFEIQPFATETGRVRYEVFLEPLATNALFGQHAIRRVKGAFGRLDADAAGSVYQRVPASRRIHYEIISEIPSRPERDDSPTGRTAPASEVPAPYLQLPPNLDPRAVELAESVTESGATPFEKATLLEAYLKRNYDYSLELSWDPGDQPLSRFLFEAKSGHCEYFASSMAVLLRIVGIPTRIVNGFLPGEFNAVGGSYIVRQSDAHSWVEVYIPGSGWIDFDPTPPNPDSSEMSMAVLLTHYLDAADLFWNSYMLTYDSGTQLQLFRNAQDSVQAWREGLRNRLSRGVAELGAFSHRFSSRLDRLAGTISFWSVILLSLAVGVSVRHRHAIRKRWPVWAACFRPGSVGAEAITELFYTAAALATGQARNRLPHETWREWVALLPNDGRRPLVREALEIFESVRYGGRPASVEAFSALRHAVGRLKNIE